MMKKSIIYFTSGIVIFLVLVLTGIFLISHGIEKYLVIISAIFYFSLNGYLFYVYSHKNLPQKVSKNSKEPITFIISVRPLINGNESYADRVIKVVESVKKQDVEKEILVYMADKTDGLIVGALEGTDYKIFYNFERINGLNDAIIRAKYEYLYYLDDNTIIPKEAYTAQNYFDDQTVCVSGIRYYPKSYRNNLFVDFYSRLTYSMFFGEKLKMQTINTFVNFSGSHGLFKKSYLIKHKFISGEFNRTEDAESSYYAYLVENKKMKIIDIQSEDLPPKDMLSLINQRIRWSEGWLQTYYQYINKINNPKTFKLRLEFYRKFISTYFGIILMPLSIFLIFNKFSVIGFSILIVNWLAGIIQIVYAYKLEFKEKIVGAIFYPIIFIFGSLLDTAALVKIFNKDVEWYSTKK